LSDTSARVATGQGLDAIPAWQAAAAQYERPNLTAWSFGDLPECIDLSGDSGLPLKAYPSLVFEAGQIHLRLLPDREQALSDTAKAWPELAEHCLGRTIAWLRRDLKALKAIGLPLLQLGGYEAIKEPAWAHLRRHLFETDAYLPLRKDCFEATLHQATERSKGIVPQFTDQLRSLLEAREAVVLLLEQKKTAQAISYPGMRAHLEAIAPADLLDRYAYSDLPHLTRFLKAMIRRAQRARESIQRDIDKSKRVAPYEALLGEIEELAARAPAHLAERHTLAYRMLLEEFKVSIYAQELGTAQKASEKRLDERAAAIKHLLRQSSAPQ
jgi:ATP-dependent helicase HrpA